MTRINERIRVPQIRLSAPNGEAMGIMDTRDALAIAKKHGLDLVEISPTAKPPACRIMDYGKFKYEKSKKEKDQKKKQVQVKVKEVKFHANVGDHDYETKLRNARKFLEAGDRVKGSLFFRGRENAHREIGFEVMKRFIEDIADIAWAEQQPKLQGRQIICMIVPGKKKK